MLILGVPNIILFTYCPVMFIIVFQCLNICCGLQFFVNTSIAEMQREEVGNVGLEIH